MNTNIRKFSEEKKDNLINQLQKNIILLLDVGQILKKIVAHQRINSNARLVLDIDIADIRHYFINLGIQSRIPLDFNMLKKKNMSQKEIKQENSRIISEIKEGTNKAIENVNLLLSELNLEEQKFLGQPTFDSLLYSTRQKQKGNITEFASNKLEDRNKALDLLASLIENDEALTREEKDQILNDIDNADANNLSYEIDRWLGKKLTKPERRLLRVLRRIAYKLISKGKITGGGLSLYEVEMPLSEIYEEWGLKKRTEGGFNEDTPKIIKSILFDRHSGLHAKILFKHKLIMCTSYILQVQEIYRTVERKVNGMIKKEKQFTDIRIALPSFLFVSNNDTGKYYYQSLEGFKRFMAIDGIAQSDAAFNVAEYLECFLHSPLEIKPLNLQTMVEEAGLSELYLERPSRVIERIENILNKMVEAQYLISKWHFDRKGGKHGQGQYLLHNIRAQMFQKQEAKRKAKIIPISKKITKSKSSKNKNN